MIIICKYITYYYNREYFSDYKNTIELLKKDNVHCIDNAAGLANIELESFNKIILVQSHQPVADPLPAGLALP